MQTELSAVYWPLSWENRSFSALCLRIMMSIYISGAVWNYSTAECSIMPSYCSFDDSNYLHPTQPTISPQPTWSIWDKVYQIAYREQPHCPTTMKMYSNWILYTESYKLFDGNQFKKTRFHLKNIPEGAMYWTCSSLEEIACCSDNWALGSCLNDICDRTVSTAIIY